MELKKILGLNKGSVVSIVGAGGKTTFLFTLAEELRKKHKVLLTTTTKIYLPEKKLYDYLSIGTIDSLSQENQNGIYVFGSNINEDKKIIGVKPQFKHLLPYFDYILIEADGAKQKCIKGWNSTEPVISKDTTITVGIVSIDAVGKRINKENVHRVEEFIKITNSIEDELIKIKHLIALILHKNGLFNKARGKKILFINKVESEEEKKLAKAIVHELRDHLDQIIIGSLKQEWAVIN